MVHAGPFAKYCRGQSSIIGDRLGLKLFDYHVTEAFRCRHRIREVLERQVPVQRAEPNVSVLTDRSSPQMHGGGPTVSPGVPIRRIHEGKRKAWWRKVATCSPSEAHPQVGESTRWCASPLCYRHGRGSEDDPQGRRGSGCPLRSGGALAKGGEGALELADAVLDAARTRSISATCIRWR